MVDGGLVVVVLLRLVWRWLGLHGGGGGLVDLAAE
jgi:hypothetical protein